ncbi:MAG: (2Fe-2S)-binding protein [Bacteroidales bacterium]|nr:(2Fe-2S)-binding protein [Bacteroidales bacterium]MDD4384241.1 (2Fe-2S)-binding protein [Bacteroidales bacterium]MDY0197429.1 (2Fe-2S)-binding protein [Tenuifilaceae bacterium]
MTSKRANYVCECKAVFRNEIVNSIKKGHAQTLLDIQNLTKASTGCGRCKNQVEWIINTELEKKRKHGLQLRLNL